MKLKIFVADRQIVRPGDVLAEIAEDNIQGFKRIPEKHVYIANNRIYSDAYGVASISDNDITVIPFNTVYYPKKEDVVIGVVEDVGITSWTIDIRSPYRAVLNGNDVIDNFNPIYHDLRAYLDVGDMILAKIVAFDRTRDPLLTIRGKGLGKIIEGFIIEIKPSRVPRVIGKKGSMYNLLTSKTGCEITVAQNGFIWAKCPDEYRGEVLTQAIKIIEEKPHVRGLTEEIRLFLEKKLAG
ncbi:exosome complex RNA-binding protein Rrp4 [Thermogladius sp. 4427co]|uniref:exosome complex RNA-binding protein Rrp4 n=1 Tax=Thermogladius sp. 4427co TaxID=3450718 RepID=UPI003F792E1B